MKKFRAFREMVEKETGRQIKKLRTDRGGEFLSTSFITYCERNGIRRQLTQARTPQQNGVAERRNRTLIEKSRSMVAECSLPAFLWTEVVNTANYLINRGPTRANHGKTPEQLYTKKIPDVSHLKTFGCICFVHVPQENMQKLSSKTTMGVFMGYDDASKVYRIYMPSERKIQLSRDVVFDESKIGFHHLKKPLLVQEEIVTVRGPTTTEVTEREVAQILEEQLIEVNLDHQSEHPSTSELPPVAEEELRPENGIPEEANIPIRTYRRRQRHVAPVELEQPANDEIRAPRNVNETHHRRYPNRERQPSSRLRDYMVLTSEMELEREPQTYHEAMQSKGWQETIASEVDSIKRNHTWEVVDLPVGKRAISAKWIFKEKMDSSGRVTKLKARLVAKGYEQIPGEDFYETFAPVVRWSTIRTIFAVSARKRWKLKQMDVKTSFLNGILEEEVYMEIPEGFWELGMEGR